MHLSGMNAVFEHALGNEYDLAAPGRPEPQLVVLTQDDSVIVGTTRANELCAEQALPLGGHPSQEHLTPDRARQGNPCVREPMALTPLVEDHASANGRHGVWSPPQSG